MIDRPPKRYYAFDTFRVDVDERQLLARDIPVQLTPKVFDILLTLVENRGHTVGKSELMERVWADSYVEEGSLNRNISTLRKALGEDGHHPRFISTVPKRGYRFDGDVREIVEDDEPLVVERHTNYRVRFHQSGHPRLIGSSRSLIFMTVIALVLIGVTVWAVIGPTSSGANSVSRAAEKSPTTNPEALELYQKSRALWQNRSVEGLHNATLDLERAITLDPQFALAYAALADAYAFDTTRWSEAEATAREAIRLDPSLGEPYATIGFVRTFWERKLAEADQLFKQAVLLSPDYATGRQWYAINLTARGLGGNGLAEMKRALDLEPDSLAINADLCQLYYFSRKYDQAIEQCQKTLKMNPDFLPAHLYLYETYTALEMYSAAVNEFFVSDGLSMTTPTFPQQLKKLRRAYDTGGIRAFWRQRIAMQKSQDHKAAYSIGRYYARLGENDEALKWFERAADSKEFEFIFFAIDPVNGQVFSDPRAKKMKEILQSTGSR